MNCGIEVFGTGDEVCEGVLLLKHLAVVVTVAAQIVAIEALSFFPAMPIAGGRNRVRACRIAVGANKKYNLTLATTVWTD